MNKWMNVSFDNLNIGKNLHLGIFSWKPKCAPFRSTQVTTTLPKKMTF